MIKACIKQLAEGKSMNNRFLQNIPNLGGVQMLGGSAENEDLDNSDRQSLIVRNNECVICMDNQRGLTETDTIKLTLKYLVI